MSEASPAVPDFGCARAVESPMGEALVSILLCLSGFFIQRSFFNAYILKDADENRATSFFKKIDPTSAGSF